MSNTKKFKFSGHQTFAFRYGWLEKGVRAVVECPTAFSEEDALVRLGVGKNMVESIRHWCLLTQMLEEDPEVKRNNGRLLLVSAIGRRLLEDGAWDPFLEDDASLWLIHWLLVSNPRIGTTWEIAFSSFQRPDFTKQELLDYLGGFAEKRSFEVNKSSLSRDVDCFLRTYARARTAAKKQVAEETFDCPLQELNLINLSLDGELYRFEIGPKPTLPTAVFGFALAQYFEMALNRRNTMSVQECLYGPGSPGQAFKLDENSLIEYLEELGKDTKDGIVLDETAGLKQIYRKRALDAIELLEDYYARDDRK